MIERYSRPDFLALWSDASRFETWLCVATKERVELSRKDYLEERESMVFERAVFEVKGCLPTPPV